MDFLDFTKIHSYLNIGLIALAAVILLITLITGYRRGFMGQVLRTSSVVISVFISIYLARLLHNTVMVWLDGQTTEDIILLLEQYGLNLSENEFSSLLNYVDTRTLNFILAIPMALVVVPVAFVPIFLIIDFVMMLIIAIVAKIFRLSKRHRSFGSRALGATVGILQGALVTLVLCAPFVGMLTTVSDVVYTMQEKTPEKEATVTVTESYNEYIKPFSENTGVVIMSKCGGKLLYNTLTTLHLYEEKYEMTETVSTPAIQIYAASSKLEAIDWQNLTEDNKKGINAILDALNESPYLSNLVADVLNSAACAYNDGAFVFTAEGEASELLGAAISVFDGIDKDSLNPTISVLRDAYYTLSDEGVISALSGEDTSEISDILTKKDEAGTTVLSKVISKLNSNQRTSKLVTAITKLSITVMADSFGGNVTGETYEKVVDGIKDVIAIDKNDYVDNPDGYVDAISDSLNKTFTDNGIELDGELVDKMAEHVAKNYSDVTSLTDQEINDIILSYYDAYLEYLDTGVVPDGLPDGVINGSGE